MGHNMNRFEQEPNYSKILRSLGIWVLQIAVVIFLAFLFVNYGVEKMTVKGDYMDPTIKESNNIIINKMSYRFTEPKRFDIIVFKQHGKEHSFYNMKRIVGMPGETVQIQDGFVYINGIRQEEIVTVEKMENGGLANQPITLDENEYFVLGDNRNHSEDSRFASVGNVLKEDVVGKAWFDLTELSFVHSSNLVMHTTGKEQE